MWLGSVVGQRPTIALEQRAPIGSALQLGHRNNVQPPKEDIFLFLHIISGWGELLKKEVLSLRRKRRTNEAKATQQNNVNNKNVKTMKVTNSILPYTLHTQKWIKQIQNVQAGAPYWKILKNVLTFVFSAETKGTTLKGVNFAINIENTGRITKTLGDKHFIGKVPNLPKRWIYAVMYNTIIKTSYRKRV